MTSSDTIRIQNADLSKIVFGPKQPPPKDSQYSIDNVFISYENDKQWPRFQFPILEHPFDSFNTKYGGNADGSIDMMLSFDPDNAKHVKVMNKVKDFDDMVYQMVKQNSATWLKKAITTEQQESVFLDPDNEFWFPSLKVKKAVKDGTPVLKDGKQIEYFSMKFKIPKRAPKGGGEKKLTTEVKDMETDEVVSVYDYLTPKCYVQVIGRPARVYIQKQQKVGILWEASFMRIKKNETASTEKKELYVADSDEENDSEPAPTIEDDIENDVVDDSDDADEVVEEKAKPATKGRGKKGAK